MKTVPVRSRLPSSAVRSPEPGRSVGAVVLGGDYQGLGIVRSLGRYGIPMCVVDDERSIAGVSRFSTHRLRVRELRTAEGTLGALDVARRRFGLDGWVLYPTRDETVAILAAHRQEFEGHFRVPTPAWECIEQAWDKRRTYRLAQKLSKSSSKTGKSSGREVRTLLKLRNVSSRSSRSISPSAVAASIASEGVASRPRSLRALLNWTVL